MSESGRPCTGRFPAIVGLSELSFRQGRLALGKAATAFDDVPMTVSKYGLST